jgi:hypothetical protein
VSDRKPPSEREWKRAAVLEPRLVARQPELVSDGAGLPFPPAALSGDAEPLDAQDGAAAGLLALLATRGLDSLDGWRLLARTDDEALFGRGGAANLTTVAVKRERRGDRWSAVASSVAQPLRASRDGVRASSWRIDEADTPQPQDGELRVLVTEQTFASGQRADRRVLTPDLYVGEQELVLTLFVKPRPGYQTGSRNPETPVRIVLPEPVGRRALIDGALA